MERSCSFLNGFSPKHVVVMVLLVMHLALLVPLFVISAYDVPSADDYTAAIQNRQVNEINPSFLERAVINLQNTVQAWKTMQGTFSAYFFFESLNPTGENNGLYFLCPVLLLLMFHFSLFFMLWQMLYHGLGISRNCVLIIYCILATVLVQLIPSAAEGFYWYSGATLYTGFFCIAMFGIGLIVKLMRSDKKVAVLSFSAAFLGFIVGGSNYPSAVGFVYVVCLAMGYSLLYRPQKAARLVLPLLFSVAGLLLSVWAPGNTARLERECVVYRGELISTIRISLLLGKQFFRSWFTLPVAVALIGAEPVIIYALRKSKCRFCLPFLWIVLAFCGYAALFAPSAYSYGWIGPQRYMNIVFFGYVLMLFSCEIYVTGWIIQKIRQYCSQNETILIQIEEALICMLKKNAIYVAVLIAMSLSILSSYDYYTNAEGTHQRQIFASESAYRDLKNWQAQNYYEQYRERMQVLEDAEVLDVFFEPYRAKPMTLYFDDITMDANDWRNQSLQQYYNKNSIQLTGRK